MATTVTTAGRQRKRMQDAGDAYIEHLEHVMERKRTPMCAWCPTSAAGRWTRSTAPRSHRPIQFLQPDELEALIRAVSKDLLGDLERPL